MTDQSGTPETPRTEVVAAVVERDGRFLVTRRLPGAHLAGCWEFPGGKRDRSETLEEALRRELMEELGVEARVGRQVLVTEHRYDAQGTVVLHFYDCVLEGEPRPILGQQMAWACRDELGTLYFPPADAEIVRLLLTPPRR